MYTKTVTFENLITGEDVTMDFHFHISEAEMTRAEIGRAGDKKDWSDFLAEIVASDDKVKILEEMEWFLGAAYGERSEDGLSFIKDETTPQKLRNHAGYGALFTSITSTTEEMAAFVNGVFPRAIRNSIKQVENKAGKPLHEMTMDEVQKLQVSATPEDKPEEAPKAIES